MSVEYFFIKNNGISNCNKSNQHIIPACLLSQFSMKPKYIKRDSEVYAKFKGMGSATKVKVSKFLKKKNYYTILGGDGEKDQMIDLLWDDVEKNISCILDSLSNITENNYLLSVRNFIILVEFVAEHFSRSIAFEYDYKNRMERLDDLSKLTAINSKSNLNLSRLIEIYAIRPFILFAEFEIMKAPIGFHFINNENGFLNYKLFHDQNKIGVAIPLNKELILGCILNENIDSYDIDKKISELENSEGKQIKVHNLSRSSADYFNKLVAYYSNEVIYGPKEELVTSYNLMTNKILYPSLLWANQLKINQNESLEKISKNHETDFETMCDYFNENFGLRIRG